ncbi:MAG: VPLPA-CTERM-specific exosortase XrtD [Betaproteobacteria bacterium]|nr:VPLPA-CTERM-specific exosortase XrtD [Betaproteobacteria bacterium]
MNHSTSSSYRPTRTAALIVIAVLVMGIAYRGGLADLAHRWNTQEEYGHAWFIPLISAWMLWRKRQAIQPLLGRGSWFGPLLVLCGAAGLLLGEYTAMFLFIQIGFLVSLAGLTLSLGGRLLLRQAAVPLLFLLFAIPLPYFLEAQLSWQLQILSSRLGAGALQLLGIPVFLSGNLIDLGDYQLQVVDACSGLRYLYPLMSIGFLMGYLYQARWWKRMAVFLTAIPVTVLMNSFRIAVVGVLVDGWGNGMAEGFMHYFEGWLIFMACLLILLAEIAVFERFGARRSLHEAMRMPQMPPAAALVERRLPATFWVVLALLVATLVLDLRVTSRAEFIPPHRNLALFPLTLGPWQARPTILGQGVLDTLGTEDYLMADYFSPQGMVNFYVSYYASQRKGASPHSPEVCMPSNGWVITSLEPIRVMLDGGRRVDLNRAVIAQNRDRQLVYYWFDERGRSIANQYWMKWYLVHDAITMNRTDGALVRLVTPVQPGEPLERADARLRGFMQLALPKLVTYVPGRS